jgi:hypothetical protein
LTVPFVDIGKEFGKLNEPGGNWALLYSRLVDIIQVKGKVVPALN